MTLVRWAAAHGESLVARGAGSSMAGGAMGPGVIVDLVRLDAAPAIDTATRRVSVGPAITRDQLESIALRERLTFPVDPSSSGFATLGGMAATNAAGARTVKYGAMREWVHGLDCVFADGTRAWLRRGESTASALRSLPESAAEHPPAPLARFMRDVAPLVRAADPAVLRHAGVRKESSGYGLAAWRESGDAVDLVIGSEGTLALIVGLELRLAPSRDGIASLLAGFADIESAAAVAVQLAALGASAVELLDRTFLDIAASEGSVLTLPEGLEAVLIIEADADTPDLARRAAAALGAACEAGGATHVERAFSTEDERRLWQLRHAASPILNRLAPRLQSMQLVEDGCVPLESYAAYVRGVRTALGLSGFVGVIFGHAGDGHAHVNALVNVTEPDWRERAERLLLDVTSLVAKFGGTLAGEHGDGRLRAPLLPQVWPAEVIGLFAATKRAFDPDGLLNPGVKVALPGARPLDDLKYDVDLAALPAAARAALDAVSREKGWGRHRLDLIGAAPRHSH